MPSVERLGPHIGAEVAGLDVSQPLDEAAIRWIAGQLAEHAVLVLRDQKLDAAQLGAFGRRFGVPKPHLLEGYQHPDFPEVSLVTNVSRDGSVDPFGVKRATTWHSDETYKQTIRGSPCCTGSKCPGTAAARCSPTCARPSMRCRHPSATGCAG